MRFHIHGPVGIFRMGVNTYLECRCGARKVRRPRVGYSPVLTGWPREPGWHKP